MKKISSMLEASVGVPVDSSCPPGSKKWAKLSTFFDLISIAGTIRFLEDLSPNIPRDGFFGC